MDIFPNTVTNQKKKKTHYVTNLYKSYPILPEPLADHLKWTPPLSSNLCARKLQKFQTYTIS